MSIYALISLVSFSFILFIGIYVFSQEPKNRINRTFVLFAFSVALWIFGEFVDRTIEQLAVVKVWDIITAPGYLFMPGIFLLFVCAFVHKKIKFLTYLLLFVPPIIFFFLGWKTNLLYSSAYIKMPWGFSAAPGKLNFLYSVVYLMSCFFYGLYLLLQFYKETKKKPLRKQIQIMIMGIFIPFIPGSITDIFFPLLKINVVPLASVFAVVGYGVVGYAIMRHRLFVPTIRAFAKEIIMTQPDAVVLVDAEGGMAFVNATGLRVLGYRREELIGKPVGILFAEEEEEEEEAFKNRVLRMLTKNEIIQDYETTLKTKTGERVPVRFNASILRDKAGDIIGAVCVARSIRELKKLQAEVMRMDRLAAVGTLAGSVAHELNNPLTGILGNAQLMLEDLSANNPLRKDLLKIEQSAQRSKKIVQRLLSFSRQEEYEFQPGDINKIIEDTFDLMGRQISLQNIKVSKEYGELPPIKVSPSQLQEVFLNLILNAVQSMPDGGELLVRTSTRIVEERLKRRSDPFHTGDRVVEIEFKDTGIGIKEKDLARVFDPFFTTKVGNGTGLGLSISHEIIQRHRGMLKVESEGEGKGAKFTVVLPVK